MSGPRNTGSLGDEQYPTLNTVLRGQGGDHLYNSNITDDDSNVRMSIPLIVTGSVRATSFTGSFSGSTAAPGTTTQIVYNSAGVLAADSGFVYSGSNVGIGTTSPSKKLSVQQIETANGIEVVGNTGGFTAIDIIGDRTSGNLGGLRAFRAGDNYEFFGIFPQANRSAVFFSTGDGLSSITPKVAILQDGNVGIRTTNPSASLHISGASSANLLRIDSPASSSILFVSGSGNVGIGTATPASRLTVFGGTTTLLGAGGASNTVVQIIQNTGSVAGARFVGTGNDTMFELQRTSDGLTQTRLTPVGNSFINALSGNLGIGTTTPSASLHISGASTANLLRIQSPASSNILFVSGSGNVGIGTTSPSTKLEIANSTSVAGVKITTTSGNETWFEAINGAGQYGRFGVATSGHAFFNTDSSGYRFLTNASGDVVRITSGGNVGIGETSPTARLEVKGSGTTSATTTLLIENANQSASLVALDNGLVGIGIIPTSASLHVNGNAYISASASTSSAALTVYKSGSTVLDVQGSQGQLFSITDSLSGSLFSVNDISGLPILEVFSDNTILMGDYLAPSLNTTEKLTVNSGVTTLYALPTSSYDGAFFDYTIRSGSNARAGQIMGIWSGSSVNFTETTTVDFGNTSGFIFGMSISGANMILSSSAATSGWTFKTIIRSI
jgi:hypothetical protein